jgi:hypothetical protein
LPTLLWLNNIFTPISICWYTYCNRSFETKSTCSNQTSILRKIVEYKWHIIVRHPVLLADLWCTMDGFKLTIQKSGGNRTQYMFYISSNASFECSRFGNIYLWRRSISSHSSPAIGKRSPMCCRRASISLLEKATPCRGIMKNNKIKKLEKRETSNVIGLCMLHIFVEQEFLIDIFGAQIQKSQIYV